MFQKTVNRQYTTGFVGDVLRDGTLRAKMARILSASVQADGSTNRIGRVFGYSDTVGIPDPALNVGAAFQTPEVAVGGVNFFGILFNRFHYAAQGSSAGTLAPTLDLPIGTEGEFVDSCPGLVVEIFNNTTSTKAFTYRDKLAYVPVGITAGNNPLALPLGAIVSYPAAGSVPTGMLAIPNAFLTTPGDLSLPASALNALVSGVALIQLAN